jgi:hypothetical protein
MRERFGKPEVKRRESSGGVSDRNLPLPSQASEISGEVSHG